MVERGNLRLVHKAVRLASALLSFALTAACSSGETREPEQGSNAVSLGRVATAPKYESVVSIAVPNGFKGIPFPAAWNTWGSGALLAPNVVLTVGHVVSDDHACSFNTRHDVQNLRIFTKVRPNFDKDKGVGVLKTFAPVSDGNSCEPDIALVVLEEPIPMPFYYSVNKNPEAYVDGRSLRVMGYGDSDAPGTYKYPPQAGSIRTGVRVVNDDDTLVMRLHAMGVNGWQFATDEVKIGHADSGGCIVDRLTNVVMGVVSMSFVEGRPPIIYTRVQSVLESDWWKEAIRYAQDALPDGHPKKRVKNYVREAPLAASIDPKIEPGAFWDAEQLTFPGFKKAYSECAADLGKTGSGTLEAESYVEPAVRTESPAAGLGYVQRFEWKSGNGSKPVWLMRGPSATGVEPDVVCMKPDLLTQAYLPTLPESEGEQAGQGCLGFPRWRESVDRGRRTLKFTTGRSVTSNVGSSQPFLSDCPRPPGG